MQARDGRWLETAGLVLVRQRPGSAKGVMFITIEDETGIANLVVWPNVFEKPAPRDPVGAGMMAVRAASSARARWCISSRTGWATCRALLASVGAAARGRCPRTGGRGDEARHAGGGHDPREPPPRDGARDIYCRTCTSTRSR